MVSRGVAASLLCLAALLPSLAAGADCSYRRSVSAGGYVFTLDSRPVSGCGIQVLRLAVSRKGKVLARIKSDIDMAVENAWADDLDKNGVPELVVVGRCAGIEKRGTVDVYRIEGGSLLRASLPGLSDSGGYRGGDRFSRSGSSIVRAIPVYLVSDAAGRPGGGTRTVTYGYAGGRLNVTSDSLAPLAAPANTAPPENAPPRPVEPPVAAAPPAPTIPAPVPAPAPAVPAAAEPAVPVPPPPAPPAVPAVAAPAAVEAPAPAPAPATAPAGSSPSASSPAPPPAAPDPAPAPAAAMETLPAFPPVAPGTVSYLTNGKGERIVVVERRVSAVGDAPPAAAGSQKSPSPQRTGMPQVTGVAVVGTSIELRGSALGKHKVIRLSKPERIAIDIAKGGSPLSGTSVAVNANGITRIRIGARPGTLRLVFDTDRTSFPKFSIRTIEGGLAVDFND